MADVFPTWGYKSDGSAQIFNLREGEELPEGWSAKMEPWNHPNTRHLHSRPVTPASEEPQEPEEPKKRGPGRPRLSETTGL